MATFSPGELRSVDWSRAHAHDRLHRPDQKSLRHFQMALVRTGHLHIVCKTSPVHVAAAPRVPHDRSVVGKAGAMLQLPAGAAEVVEASQVSEYRQLLHELITFKAMHLQK